MANNNNHLNARGLRILVFGTTGSGKTSLLGALWQAAQSQESALGGKITNPTGGLALVRESVYAQQPYETSDDLTGYPVSLEPTKGDIIDAVLIDTDGRIAEDHLSQKDVASGKSVGAKAVNSADALIFVVDPTKGTAHFEKEFQQFCTFVENLEKARSQRTEVAGLPIYLVLSKVDAYGKPTDPTGVWVQKIEDAKRKIDKKYQDVEAKYPYPDDIPFGKTDVRVWATSVKRPALADKPAKSQEPYGVAELFRQCLEAARDFHQLRQKSRSKLQLIVFGFLCILSALVGSGGLFIALRPSAELTTLETSIRDALPGFPKSSSKDRLKVSREERLDKLEKIKQNPTFAKLTEEQQDDVKQAYAEIKDYVELEKQFQKTVNDPKFAKDKNDLKNIEDSLEAVKIPEKYEKAWKETTLALNERQRQNDVNQLRSAVKIEEKWLRDQIDDGTLLANNFSLKKGNAQELKAWNDWVAQYTKFKNLAFLDQIVLDAKGKVLDGVKVAKIEGKDVAVDAAGKPMEGTKIRPFRFKDSDRLEKSHLSYRTVYRFRQIEQAEKELLEVNETLANLYKGAKKRPK